MKQCLTLFVFLAVAAIAQGQPTLTLAPIVKLLYCQDDTLTISYTTSGSIPDATVFTGQLSDGNGSFATPTASLQSALTADTFRFVLSTTGLHFRVRVTANATVVAPADNGQDLEVLTYPVATVSLLIGRNRLNASADSVSGPAIMFGQPARLSAISFPPADTFHWTFNDDANISFATGDSVTVDYSSPGLKSGFVTPTNRAGCGIPEVFSIRVLSCDPAIPRGTAIVRDSESSSSPFIWVRNGGVDSIQALTYPQTVFVDSGGTVIINSDQEWNTFYVQKGGILAPAVPNRGTVISTGGVQYPVEGFVSVDTISCPDLTFQPEDGVLEVPTLPDFRIVQLGLHVSVITDEPNYQIHIYDPLGMEVYRSHGSESEDYDFSKLPEGIYFIEVESSNARKTTKLAILP